MTRSTLTDTSLGLPSSQWSRHVPVGARGAGARARAAVFNLRSVRQTVIPAATVSSTAHDLARFYQMLLAGGELEGARLLDPATITVARQPSSDGEIDRHLQVTVRWSQGFRLGGPDLDPARPRPMGRRSSPDTFGHNGSNCCLAWVDPRRRIVLAYLTDRLQPGLEGSPHLSDAVLAASLTRFVGDPAYDLYELRVDLDRFGFPLDADHDERLLEPREQRQPPAAGRHEPETTGRSGPLKQHDPGGARSSRHPGANST